MCVFYPQSGDFVSYSTTELMVSFEDMQRLYRDPCSQILDVRKSLHFDGKVDEPTECKASLLYKLLINHVYITGPRYVFL